MSSNLEIDRLQEVCLALSQRARTDADLRAELTRDPESVLEREAGLSSGSLKDAKITVVEASPGKITVAFSEEEVELKEGELDRISGGTGGAGGEGGEPVRITRKTDRYL